MGLDPNKITSDIKNQLNPNDVFNESLAIDGGIDTRLKPDQQIGKHRWKHNRETQIKAWF